MSYQYNQGIFKPINPEKYVGDVNNICYRSSWERKLMTKLDCSEKVVKWASEEFPIPYYDTYKRKNRRYFIDFYVLLDNNKKYAIEVKPYSQTIPPEKPKRNTKKRQERYLKESITYQNNCDKWLAAKEWCKKNGLIFLILHEKNVGGLF